MKVREMMNANVVSITPEESVALAARLLSRHNVGVLPVCDGSGTLRGVITDRDIVLRCVAAEEQADQMLAKDVMTRGCATVSPDDDVREATRLMTARQVRRLPVTEGGKVIGMLSLGDLARSHRYDMEASKALSEISDHVRKGGT
ncbi:MAG: CBS domain-containing protein [Oscillospiraceae bacterium]|nr:CBS domain-containing protein [Oscillospiraceae bacterium]